MVEVPPHIGNAEAPAGRPPGRAIRPRFAIIPPCNRPNTARPWVNSPTTCLARRPLPPAARTFRARGHAAAGVGADAQRDRAVPRRPAGAAAAHRGRRRGRGRQEHRRQLPRREPVAEANPQAGFTRHPTAFLPPGPGFQWPSYIGFLGPLHRLTRTSPRTSTKTCIR